MSLIPRSFYLDDIFDDLGRSNRINEMKCDIYEKDGIYNIEMDVPGYDKKDIKIECENNVLVVTAERSVENNDDSDKSYIRKERVYGKVSRTFNFTDIDEDSISADFNNGVLLIKVPKLVKNESKKVIEIQ